MIPVNELARGYRLYQEEYEQKALKVLRSGWYVLGKEVEQFELEYANALGEGVYCAGVDNGLNAIRLGLHACGIGGRRSNRSGKRLYRNHARHYAKRWNACVCGTRHLSQYGSG